jgi:hypothetical protein
VEGSSLRHASKQLKSGTALYDVTAGLSARSPVFEVRNALQQVQSAAVEGKGGAGKGEGRWNPVGHDRRHSRKKPRGFFPSSEQKVSKSSP